MFDLDLTYKVQTEPGGIAQVVGMAEGFAGGGKARGLPGRQPVRVRRGQRDSRMGGRRRRRTDLHQGGARPRALRRRRVRRGRARERRRREGGRRRHALRVAADVGCRCGPVLLRRRRVRRHPRASSRPAAESSRSPTSTARTPSRAASTSGACRVGGTTRVRTRRSPSSVHWSRRPGRTSPHEGRRGDPAPAVRGRARLVRRARPRVAARRNRGGRRTSRSRVRA